MNKLSLQKIPLKWKVYGFLLGFCALLLVILWLFQTVFLNDMYKLIRRSEMQKAIAYVEKNLETTDFTQLLNYIKVKDDILIGLNGDFNDEQKALQQQQSDALREFNKQLQKPWKEGHGGFRTPEALTEERQYTLSDGSVLNLTFYAMITPLNATVTTLRYQLYYITAILLLLAAALAFLISRHISKPIEQLNASAKQLARGDYTTQFGGKGFLEIAELSDTLTVAATELGKTEALRRELMANISHDMRTPLSLIYSHAEMMHDFPTEITPEQTQVIMDETRRLTSLVNDVLDISKLETGVQQLSLSQFDLTVLIGDTTARMAELVKKDGYTITFSHDVPCTVTADEVKVTQAFYNLLINAINYSVEDKTIAVQQLVSHDRVVIEVTDHGTGIAPENLPHIWDRYYKVDKKHKRAVTGTGLGLSIVKKVMDLQGGSYGVRSQEGAGSTFWFSLPL